MYRSDDFRFGFRVLGDCRQPRRVVDAGAALTAYAACDARCELDRESYLSAFCFDAGFRRHLDGTNSTAGYHGPCWASWLWWDVDAPDGELSTVREPLRRLIVAVVDGLQTDEDDLLVFLSGSKGFHVGIPTALWSPEPGRDFHRIVRRFAETVAERAGVDIDNGVYDRVRCWRAPNSRHPKTGLHKRRLTVDEASHLSTEALLTLAKKPEPFELPRPTARSEPASRLWAEVAGQVRSEAEAKAAPPRDGSGPVRLNRGTLEYIRNGAATGDRHRLLYSAAADLAGAGASLGLCDALLSEAALDCGLPPMDVRRAVENGWTSVQPGVRDVCEAVDGKVINVHSGPTEATTEGGAA